MTYSADFEAQVIKSVKNKDMSIREACTFYNISKTALQRWLKNPNIKQTRNKPPSKIPNDVLLKDVEQYPDDYMYERAQRLNCSKSGIEIALKRLGISQKKDLRTSWTGLIKHDCTVQLVMCHLLSLKSGIMII